MNKIFKCALEFVFDADDKEKYVPLYRKPAKSKKPSVNDKEKFYSVKAKFDTTNEPDGVPKKIKTEFWDLSSVISN